MTITYTNFNNACLLREQRGDLEEEVGVCAILQNEVGREGRAEIFQFQFFQLKIMGIHEENPIFRLSLQCL